MFRGSIWFDITSAPGLIDWIVNLVGIAALIMAAWQLHRTTNALNAAKESYEETRYEFAKAQLIREIVYIDQHVNKLVAGAHQTDRNWVQNRFIA